MKFLAALSFGLVIIADVQKTAALPLPYGQELDARGPTEAHIPAYVPSISKRVDDDLEIREPIAPALVGAAISLAPTIIKNAPKIVSGVKKFFSKFFRRDVSDDEVDQIIANLLSARAEGSDLEMREPIFIGPGRLPTTETQLIKYVPKVVNGVKNFFSKFFRRDVSDDEVDQIITSLLSARAEDSDLEMREPIAPALIGAAISLAPEVIKHAPQIVSGVKKFFSKFFRRDVSDDEVNQIIANLLQSSVSARDENTDLEMREPIAPALIGAAISLAPEVIKHAPKIISGVKKFFSKLFRRDVSDDEVDQIIANLLSARGENSDPLARAIEVLSREYKGLQL